MHARLLWHRAQRIDSSRLRNSGDSLVGYDMAATRATATDQTGDRSAGCTAAGCTLRITVWLEVRILPGPPGSLSNRKISVRLTKGPQLAGSDVAVSASAETCSGVRAIMRELSLGRGNPVSRKRRPLQAEIRFE